MGVPRCRRRQLEDASVPQRLQRPDTAPPAGELQEAAHVGVIDEEEELEGS